jgi:hypothetical protein
MEIGIKQRNIQKRVEGWDQDNPFPVQDLLDLYRKTGEVSFKLFENKLDPFRSRLVSELGYSGEEAKYAELYYAAGIIAPRVDQALAAAGFKYFPVPTLISQLQPAFSPVNIFKPEIVRGKVTIWRCQIQKGKAINLSVQKSFHGADVQMAIKAFERGLRRILSPYGLKVFLAIIKECDPRDGEMVLSLNRLLDLLGYKRSKRGYHRTENRRRLIDVIYALGETEFDIEFKRRGHKREMETTKTCEPLIGITRKQSVDLPDRENELDGALITIPKYFYMDEIERCFFTWIPENLLSIDVNRHPYSLAMYTYLIGQIRMRWTRAKHKYKYRGKLRSILKGCGIAIQQGDPNRARKLAMVMNDFALLGSLGLVGSFQIVERGRNPLEDLWEIVIPESHPMSRMEKDERR